VYWVYILENPEGRFYIGQTDDLANRLFNHNRTDKVGGKFTRKEGPWKLAWSEIHPDRPSAVRRERQIKSMKSAEWIRTKLLNGRVPAVRDRPAGCRFSRPVGMEPI
jgi:putative endonuclease